MKIVDTRKALPSRQYGKLRYGECFIFQHKVFMKLTVSANIQSGSVWGEQRSCFAVDLEEGRVSYFTDDVVVSVVEAEVHING